MPKKGQKTISVNTILRPQGPPILAFAVRVLIVLTGCFIGSVSVNSFFVPAHILTGGLTGLSQTVYHFTGFPIGTLYFLFNIPLFLLGYKYLGKQFVVLTGIGIVAFSGFIDLVHIHFTLPAQDPLLICLYGGVLGGLSSGLIIRVGGSAGGADILSLVVHRVTGRSVGSVSFALNIVVVLLSMSVFGIESGLYTLVAMFATSRVINTLLNYQNRKTALIVSPLASDISKAIAEQLGRGSTLLHASGTYTNSTTGVLMCALTHLELAELKTLCLDIDPTAFISILDTTEVVGRFRNLPV